MGESVAEANYKLVKEVGDKRSGWGRFEIATDKVDSDEWGFRYFVEQCKMI
jgi:hypothetical protein